MLHEVSDLGTLNRGFRSCIPVIDLTYNWKESGSHTLITAIEKYLQVCVGTDIVPLFFKGYRKADEKKFSFALSLPQHPHCSLEGRSDPSARLRASPGNLTIRIMPIPVFRHPTILRRVLIPLNAGTPDLAHLRAIDHDVDFL